MVWRSCSTNLAKTNFSSSGAKGIQRNNIPAGDHVNAAVVAGNGRDCRQRRKPILPGANGFEAKIGQNEINGRGDGIGVGVKAQQLVRRAVGAGRVRAHAESVGNRLEMLLLFVDAFLRSPPPGLMHERPVRGIHEADDAVVHVAGQVGGEVGDFIVVSVFTPKISARGARKMAARQPW